MRFEWDEAKRRSNIEKHDIDFRDAEALFDGRMIMTRPSSRGYEERFVTVGVSWIERASPSFGRGAAKMASGSARSDGQFMRKKGNIVSYSHEELEDMRRRGETETDWARLDAMTEEELEAAIASDPDWGDIPHDWYEDAKPGLPFPLP